MRSHSGSLLHSCNGHKRASKEPRNEQVEVGSKLTFYVFFNDQYLINYSTDHIPTKPIRKIKSELSIHLLDFNHILTEINIKTNDGQENSQFWWTYWTGGQLITF